MMKVVTSDDCKYCEVLKVILDTMGKEYKEIKIDTPEGRALVKKMGIRALPTIVVNNKAYVGIPPFKKLKKIIDEDND